MDTNEFTKNVALIRKEGIRMIQGTIPRDVRNELMSGVKSGALGRLKKNSLQPEFFFHPDYKDEAIQQQINKALYAIERISKVVQNKKVST